MPATDAYQGSQPYDHGCRTRDSSLDGQRGNSTRDVSPTLTTLATPTCSVLAIPAVSLRNAPTTVFITVIDALRVALATPVPAVPMWAVTGSLSARRRAATYHSNLL